MADHANKNQSHLQLKNTHRAEDGKRAMADYEAQAAAIRAKTERLKALRLSQQVAEKTAAPKAAGSTKKKPAKKADGASLSEWLKDQEKGGRRT